MQKIIMTSCCLPMEGVFPVLFAKYCWVQGDMINDPTNTACLDASPLTAFVGKNYPLWKCPADRTIHVRSMSMNYLVGGNGLTPDSAPPYYGLWTSHKAFKLFRKLSEMHNPTMTWVIMDERPTLINDAFFVVDMAHYDNPRGMEIIDHPGMQHNNSAGLSFADGHAEIKQWKDAPFLTPNPTGRVPAPNSRDLFWLMERTSQKK